MPVMYSSGGLPGVLCEVRPTGLAHAGGSEAGGGDPGARQSVEIYPVEAPCGGGHVQVAVVGCHASEVSDSARRR